MYILLDHMRILFTVISILSFSVRAQDRQATIDSLERELLKYEKNDSNVINLLLVIGGEYAFVDLEIETQYYERAIRLSRDLKLPKHFVRSSNNLGTTLYYLGEYEKAIEVLNSSVKIARKNRLVEKLGETLILLGQVEDYFNSEFALDHLMEGIEICEEYNLYSSLSSGYNSLAVYYYYRDQEGEAMEYFDKAKKILSERLDNRDNLFVLGTIEVNIGKIYSRQEKFKMAREQFELGIKMHDEYDPNSFQAAFARNTMAEHFISQNKYDDGI
ncbi:tetratricopeptide repeat protein, partial [Crocinitomix catalasitica]|nr:tetratricopeptide repeat protein [Crocinitomix catalasitica]